MNTGICNPYLKRRVLLAVSFCMGLSACSTGIGEGFSFASLGAGDAPTEGAQTGPVIPKTTKTTLARGTVTLKAPKGYCIDETSVSNGLTGSYAMLSNCSSLDGKGAGVNAATMTVSVSPRRQAGAPVPTPQDFAAALAPAEVISAKQKGALTLVQVTAEEGSPLTPADPIHWRGATVLDTRLILLAIYAPAGAMMSGDKGGELLVSLARGISTTRTGLLDALTGPLDEGSTADTAPPTPVQGETDETALNAEGSETPKKGLFGSIGRLFNPS